MRRRVPARRGTRAVLCFLGFAMSIAGCAGSSSTAVTSGPDSPVVDHPNPLAGDRFYVNPSGHAAAQERVWSGQGRTADVAWLQRISREPVATWFTGGGGSPYDAVSALSRQASSQATVPILTVYNVPGRDCGSYSGGGATDARQYLDWLGAIAAGLGDRGAVVIVEPDAIAQSVEGCPGAPAAADRYQLLGQAVRMLKRQPHVAVYLDAGNADWISTTRFSQLVEALTQSGIREADGFALNVSNFVSTTQTVAYGTQLSQRLDRAHFVIDTSRNGLGTIRLPDGRRAWCNPAGRRLGTTPVTAPGPPLVDALLWIKQPGDSDGECGKGDPPAGSWWPNNARELVG